MRWALLLALALQSLRACKGQSATASVTTSDVNPSTQTVQTISGTGNHTVVKPVTAPASSASTSLTSSLATSLKTVSPAGPTKSSRASVTVSGGSSPSGSTRPTTVAVGTTPGGSPTAPSGVPSPSTATPNPILQPTTRQTLPVAPSNSSATSTTTVTFSSPTDGAKSPSSPGHVSTRLVTTPSPKASPYSTKVPLFPKDVKSTVSSATHGGPKTATGSSGGTTGSAGTSKEPTANISKASAALPARPTLPKGTGTTTATNLVQTQGTTTTQSPRVTLHLPGSGPGPEATAKTVATTSASCDSPSGDDCSETHQAPFQIKCVEKVPQDQQPVLLTLNVSRPCDGLDKSPLKELLLEVLCRAVKPNFNRSRDSCTVRLASSEENQKNVAVIDVSVKTISVAKELFESLATKKGELEKIGVTNITHAGRTTDVDTEDRFSMPLIITIVCMAASLLLVAAIYGCCHQRISQRKDQQRLTEELQTMENGYHDNPTLEVMETSSEMQEKKIKLNGELGDSWIVPMDNLTKEDLEEEEDTHL